MLSKQKKPAWFILYALVISMIAVFMFENKDGLPTWANEFVTFGIVLFVFGAMLVWAQVNSSALWEDELKNIRPGEYRIQEYPPQILSPHLQDEIQEILESNEARAK